MKNRGLREGLLDLIFPKKCPFCGRIVEGGALTLCPRCRENLPWRKEKETGRPEWVEEYYAPLWYRGQVQSSVHRFKFGGCSFYATVYAAEMADRLRECGADRWDGVTWVPIHPKRKKRRGYDQSELLAKAVAEALGLPSLSLLRKTVNTPPQSTLPGEEARRANVLGVYEVTEGAWVEGKKLLLVDDVMTTGATLSQCALMLKLAGADHVAAVNLAKVGKEGGAS